MSDESLLRIQANNAFSKLQTKSIALDRLQSDIEAVRSARDENMVKLKQMRLARDAADQEAALGASEKLRPQKPAAKRASTRTPV